MELNVKELRYLNAWNLEDRRNGYDFIEIYTRIKFLPRNAMQSVVMPQYISRFCVRPSVSVCLFVCLSVTFKYRDHIGWNTSKTIIPQLNSLR